MSVCVVCVRERVCVCVREGEREGERIVCVCVRERQREREKPQARDDGHVSFLNHGGRFAVKVIASFSPLDGYSSALHPKPFNVF